MGGGDAAAGFSSCVRLEAFTEAPEFGFSWNYPDFPGPLLKHPLPRAGAGPDEDGRCARRGLVHVPWVKAKIPWRRFSGKQERGERKIAGWWSVRSPWKFEWMLSLPHKRKTRAKTSPSAGGSPDSDEVRPRAGAETGSLESRALSSRGRVANWSKPRGLAGGGVYEVSRVHSPWAQPPIWGDLVCKCASARRELRMHSLSHSAVV